MKTQLAAVVIGGFLAEMLTGGHGVKASTDNATVINGLHYDAAGKLVDEPEVTVSLWSSKKLKEKPTAAISTKDAAQ